MPITADFSRPQRTVDASGRPVSTETNQAAPMKTVDSVGRDWKAAEPSAEADTEKSAETNAEAITANEGEKAPSAADVRKEWLEAQRARRRASEAEKKAKSGLERAEAIEKARALAENGEDPTALLKAAGLDPLKFYRDMTTYALSDKGKAEETDPVKRELNEQKQRLDKYSKDLEEQAKKIQDREETAAHNKVIQEHVIPLLRDNSEQYETLLMQYGTNAAVEVYQTVWQIYQETGKARSFKEVADEMEAYWEETLHKGFENALKLKKFRSKYPLAQEAEAPASDSGPEVTKRPSVTLSNKRSAPLPVSPVKRSYQTRDERVAEILKRHGG